MIVFASQSASDHYPFVIAGRYTSAKIGGRKEKSILWTRKAQKAAGLRGADDALVRTMEAYDSTFGVRSKDSSTTYIVECPAAAGCFTNFNASTAKLLGDDEKEPTSAETVSLDTIVVDLSGGTQRLAVAAAPSPPTAWLRYGQNPAFYHPHPPPPAPPP